MTNENRSTSTEKSPMHVILFGPPGSGKGTQSMHLVKKFGFVHISTGDILREEIKNGTALGRLAEEFMRDGRLVPDEHLFEMVKKNFSN